MTRNRHVDTLRIEMRRRVRTALLGHNAGLSLLLLLEARKEKRVHHGNRPAPDCSGRVPRRPVHVLSMEPR